MNKKNQDLVSIVEGPKFLAFSGYMLGMPRTIEETARISKVSKMTIYNYIKLFKETFSDKKYFAPEATFSKKKPYSIKMELLADYIAERIKLLSNEKQALLDIIEQEDIKKVLIGKQESLYTAIYSVFLLFLAFDQFTSQIEDAEPMPKFSAKGTSFADLLNSNLYDLTAEEKEKWFQAVQALAAKHRKILPNLIKKIIESDIILPMKMRDIFSMIATTRTFAKAFADIIMMSITDPRQRRAAMKNLAKTFAFR